MRHLGAIDDILIANNIAKSASGEKAETYNYWWRWEDDADSNLASTVEYLKPSGATSSKGGIVLALS